jgi:Flp pilus assembly protein TadG
MIRQGRHRRASAVIEAAMWVPLLFAFFFGIVEFGRLSYTYYTVHKILYNIARAAGTQPGSDFCDDADPTIQAIKEFTLASADEENSSGSVLDDLTPEMIAIRVERYNADTEQIEECECANTGCDAVNGGVAPGYITVSIPDGYPIQLTLPALNLDPIPLRPVVRIPYGGL